MSSLASWIDVGAVSDLARDLCPEDDPDLMRPAARPSNNGAPALAIDSLIDLEVRPSTGRGLRGEPLEVADYPHEEEVSRVREKLERIKALARNSGLIERPEGLAEGQEAERRNDATSQEEEAGEELPVEIPSLEIPAGALGIRLTAFAEWASLAVCDATVFVIDSQGYPLIEQGANPDLLAAALLLADASRRASGHVGVAVGEAGLLQMDVGIDETLTVFPVDTQYGMLCLGLQHRAVIGRELGERLRDGLLATLNC